MKKILYGVLGVLVVILIVFAVKVVQVERGRDSVQNEIKSKSFPKISPFDSVKKISILPLVDYYGEGKDIKTEPRVLRPGIASIGAIPRYLFLVGYTEEQSLAINVQGKGIVLITYLYKGSSDQINENGLKGSHLSV